MNASKILSAWMAAYTAYLDLDGTEDWMFEMPAQMTRMLLDFQEGTNASKKEPEKSNSKKE